LTVIKNDIRQLSLDELSKFFEENGLQSFRAKQVFQWLWQKGSLSFDEMTNLSKPARTLLLEKFDLPHLSIAHRQDSVDGTVKVGFKLHDGNLVEGVLIPVAEEKRMTACISSQVGCSLSCKFCNGYVNKTYYYINSGHS